MWPASSQCRQALSFLRLPALCEEVAGEFGEMDGAADIRGLPPVPPL